MMHGPAILIGQPKVTGKFLGLMVLVYFLLGIASHSLPTLGDALGSFSRSTGYLLHPTLLNYLPYFAVLGMLWWQVGKLSPGDLGLARSGLPRAVLWGLGFWVTAQLIALLVRGGEAIPASALSGGLETTLPLGALLGQLLGNALCEELFFRGFVLVQVAALLQSRLDCSPTRALLLGVVVSSLLFALSHLPRDLKVDMSLARLLVLQGAWMSGGLVFAGIYVLSGNLFLPVVFHALTNVPLPLLEGFGGAKLQSYYAIGPLLLLWVLRFRPETESGDRGDSS